MMNRTKILFLLMLVAASVFPIISIEADSKTFEPLTGITDPEKYYSVYLEPDGTLKSDTIMIPIVPTAWESPTVAAILFPNITLNSLNYLNNATLKLYFDGDLETTTENLWVTVYGADAVFNIGSNLNGITSGFPVSSAYTNVNLINITSAQWVEIDVTSIVEEVLNKYAWESGLGISFILYGLPTDTARSYQSNVGTKYPHLEIVYDVIPSEYSDGEYVGNYRGWNLYLYNQSSGLVDPNYWLPLPWAGTAATVQQVDSDTKDSAYIVNGDFGEIWTNLTLGENYLNNILQHTLVKCDTTTKVAYAGPDGDYDHSDNSTWTKVVVWCFERVYGTDASVADTIGWMMGIGNRFSGSMQDRETTNPWVGLRVQARNDESVTLTGYTGSGGITAYIENYNFRFPYEGKNYIVKYGMRPFGNYWLSHKYSYEYFSTWYLYNQTTGTIIKQGHFDFYFNMSSTNYQKITQYEMWEHQETGVTRQTYLVSYFLRGFVPEMEYTNGFVIENDNETINTGCYSLECVENWINNNIFGDSGATDDPNPSGWDSIGGFSRANVRMYFFIIGWLMVWLPIYALTFIHGFDRVEYTWYMLFMIVIGLALLWSIPHI